MSEREHNASVAEDDVDRLFARLQPVNPPPNFVAAVMEQATESAASPASAPSVAPAPTRARSAAGTLAWLALQLLGALLVGLAAYWLGHAFWTNGAYDLLALLREDAELVSAYGDAHLQALLDTVPRLQLCAVDLTLAATALTWVYSRPILRLFAEARARNGSR